MQLIDFVCFASHKFNYIFLSDSTTLWRNILVGYKSVQIGSFNPGRNVIPESKRKRKNLAYSYYQLPQNNISSTNLGCFLFHRYFMYLLFMFMPVMQVRVMGMFMG